MSQSLTCSLNVASILSYQQNNFTMKIKSNNVVLSYKCHFLLFCFFSQSGKEVNGLLSTQD